MDRVPRAGVLRFGERELDLATGELHSVPRGVPMPLGNRPARLLALLAWRHGELVTRDDIQCELWGDGTTVEFDQSINQYIRQLRQALGDPAATPVWIQTLPARGYRFLIASELVTPTSTPMPMPMPRPASISIRPSRRGVVATFAGAIGLVAFLLAASDSPPVTPAPAPLRLAVLPLAVDAPDQDARAIGFADELITTLGESYAPNLEVIALRTTMRYRDTALGIPAIARELDVDYVLEGRLRYDADRVRVSVRLIRGRDSALLWARTFDQPSQPGWTLEATIAADVASALGRTIVPARVRTDDELDGPARDAYLRGRYMLRQRMPVRAVAAFEEVTRMAPRSAKAWAGLAVATLRSGAMRFREANTAATTALALDPTQAEAHYVRALVAFYADWDVERAREEFTAAIAANPAFAEAHHDLAAVYSAEGRHDEAIASMHRAFELDPLSPEVVSDVGWYYYFARRYAEAASWCERTLALEPSFYWAHRCIVLARLRQHDSAGAAAAAIADLRARAAPAATIETVERDGLASYWRWELDREADHGDSADRAVTRLAGGDPSGALDELEHALTTRRGWLLPFLSVDPTFDELRTEPRFVAVRRAVSIR